MFFEKNFKGQATYSLEILSLQGISPVGQPVVGLERSFRESYSLTILTRLQNTPVICSGIRKQANTGWDFLEFVVYCLSQKYLERNDYLILDNATIHTSMEIIEELSAVLNAAGVQLVTLPTVFQLFCTGIVLC